MILQANIRSIEGDLNHIAQISKELIPISQQYTIEMIKLNDQIPSSIGHIGERKIDCFTEFMSIGGKETHFAIELQETGKRFLWLQDNLGTNNITITDVNYEGAEHWIGDNKAVLPAEVTHVITTIMSQTNHPYYTYNESVPSFLKPQNRLEKVIIDFSLPNLLSTKANLRLYKTDVDSMEAIESSEESVEKKKEVPLILDSKLSFEINLSSFKTADDENVTP